MIITITKPSSDDFFKNLLSSFVPHISSEVFRLINIISIQQRLPTAENDDNDPNNDNNHDDDKNDNDDFENYDNDDNDNEL